MWRIKPTLLLLNNLDLWKTSRSKYNLAPQMILSDHSICLIPHQGIGSSLFSLFLIRIFSGAQQGRWWKGSKLVLHILPNQKPDPIKKTSHTIRSRCVCAWNFLMELALLSSWLYLFILGYGLSFFFFHALCMDILFSFFYSPYLFAWWIWKVMSKWCSIFVWMRGIFLRNCFQCRSQRMSSRVRESKKTNSNEPGS